MAVTGCDARGSATGEVEEIDGRRCAHAFCMHLCFEGVLHSTVSRRSYKG
jgi:hypothetical protein